MQTSDRKQNYQKIKVCSIVYAFQIAYCIEIKGFRSLDFLMLEFF